MPGHLQVHTDRVFTTSHGVGNDAEELRDELTRIAKDWDNLSRNWSGNAAEAYAGIWAEWHDGATTLVDALADTADKLGRAAVAYENQDGVSAEGLSEPSFEVRL